MIAVKGLLLQVRMAVWQGFTQISLDMIHIPAECTNLVSSN